MYLVVERFDRRVDGDHVTLIHQEDAAQALALDWTDDDLRFQSPARPRDPERPSAYRIAELAASLGDVDVVEQWLRQLVYRILIGDNDGHAKNVGILHLPGSNRLTDLYDAVPDLFQDGRIRWDMALTIDGEFDHRRIDVDRILAEAASWRVLGGSPSAKPVSDTLTSFRTALNTVPAPSGLSDGITDALARIVESLLAGDQIGS